MGKDYPNQSYGSSGFHDNLQNLLLMIQIRPKCWVNI